MKLYLKLTAAVVAAMVLAASSFGHCEERNDEAISKRDCFAPPQPAARAAKQAGLAMTKLSPSSRFCGKWAALSDDELRVVYVKAYKGLSPGRMFFANLGKLNKKIAAEFKSRGYYSAEITPGRSKAKRGWERFNCRISDRIWDLLEGMSSQENDSDNLIYDATTAVDEISLNLYYHASGGIITAKEVARRRKGMVAGGVEVVAFDLGRGIDDPNRIASNTESRNELGRGRGFFRMVRDADELIIESKGKKWRKRSCTISQPNVFELMGESGVVKGTKITAVFYMKYKQNRELARGA